MTRSLDQRIKDDGIDIRVVGSAPDIDEFPNAHAYTVRLQRGTRQLTLPFYMGRALTREPSAHDVLECVLQDAATVDQVSDFEEWADELGYNPDSRADEKLYWKVQSQTRKLRRFLGDLYDAYLWETGEDEEENHGEE